MARASPAPRPRRGAQAPGRPRSSEPRARVLPACAAGASGARLRHRRFRCCSQRAHQNKKSAMPSRPLFAGSHARRGESASDLLLQAKFRRWVVRRQVVATPLYSIVARYRRPRVRRQIEPNVFGMARCRSTAHAWFPRAPVSATKHESWLTHGPLAPMVRKRPSKTAGIARSQHQGTQVSFVELSASISWLEARGVELF